MPPVITKQSPKPSTRKPESALDRVRPIGFDPEEGIKIMLYGRSGTGKTTVWSTFPAPILALLCSGGLRPGELRSVDTKENRTRISSCVIRDSQDIKELIDHQAETEKYRTIVLDHVTGLQDRVLAEVLGLVEIPAQKSWGMASQQDYGTATQKCKEFLRAMLNLKCNVVIVGQQRTFDSKEETGDDLIQPFVGADTTPSLHRWLAPACDYVCQTLIRGKTTERVTTLGGKEHRQKIRAEGVDYCLRTAPHDVFASKFRVPKGTFLPDVILDPDYAKIMKLIKGEGGAQDARSVPKKG